MQASIQAGTRYFAVIFTVGFILGAIRVLALEPAVGPILAVLVEMPVMLGGSWYASRWLVSRFGVPRRLGPRLAMGGLGFGLLMAAEIVLSLMAFGSTMAAYGQKLTDLPGLLGLAGQVVFGLIPVIQSVRAAGP